jgi:CRP/FNR family transcriptional regulator, cyclic AMP receptor protein
MMGAPINGSGLAATLGELFGDASLQARPLEVAAGTSLHEPDGPARHVYFIQSGQVRVYQIGPDDTNRLVEILGPGDWFGVGALAHAEVHSTRAVAVTAATVSEIPVDRLLGLLPNHPALASELVAQLARKLQNAYQDAACLVFDDCNSRLIKTLVQFSRTAAATRRDDGVVLRITHQQLAQAVGAARETISLALTQLRQQNLLRTGRNQLFFDPTVLEQFSRNGHASCNGGAAHDNDRAEAELPGRREQVA